MEKGRSGLYIRVVWWFDYFVCMMFCYLFLGLNIGEKCKLVILKEKKYVSYFKLGKKNYFLGSFFRIWIKGRVNIYFFVYIFY